MRCCRSPSHLMMKAEQLVSPNSEPVVLGAHYAPAVSPQDYAKHVVL